MDDGQAKRKSRGKIREGSRRFWKVGETLQPGSIKKASITEEEKRKQAEEAVY